MTSSSITNNIQSISLNANKFYEYLNGLSVRVYNDTDNNSWFMGKDCAEILNYRNTTKAIIDHVDFEDKCNLQNSSVTNRSSSKCHPDSVLINESGLYSLVIRSKKPEAKEFKRWITSEVLPSLRKTGEYKMPQENEMREKLENLKLGADTLETIASHQHLQERDRLLLQDLCRNVMLGSNSNINEIKQDNQEWSLSKRLNEKKIQFEIR